MVVDANDRAALDAAAACFTFFEKPTTTKSVASLTIEALARALASAREEVAIVLGENGLAAAVEELLPAPPKSFDSGEAVVLEIDARDWKSALARAHAWTFVCTIDPNEGRLVQKKR